ncbi:member of major facilitator superfamily multidrug-resistance, DHA1 sub-family [Mycena maculata]|uniref:Member of major facilitator superfamily multidrug-resistance, DHA1 sub-family n=1 Tax=Mycena maculata TaxID=230809 RepID=A0AAD7JAS4_9AGAR|nr:member of major facilitator superfamily multidrug-resistance, DHA1 sub-family [Mycena maculata]
MSPQDDVDETQPLLATRDDPNDIHDLPRKPTPLPRFQLFIVLFLQLAEPLTSQVIYPFAPQLIRDIGIINGDETKVAHYVGIMQSLFFFTQALTVLHYARLSDRIGRKPVILVGLLGLSISMFFFGLSRTFWGLVLSRSLNGALNGNIGVIKSMMAEMTDSTNIAQAYAYMPIAWSTGGVLGPIIGGSLARPAERFPSIFGKSIFLRAYPYFLPCAVPATYSIVAWIVTLLFLKETAVGPSVLTIPRIFRRDDADIVKREVLLETGPPKTGVLGTAQTEGEQAVPLRGLMTRRVIVAASSYAFLSLVDIALRAIHPVFLSTPIPWAPFQFLALFGTNLSLCCSLGGLGLSTDRIGNLLSIFGVLNGIFQVFFFARVHDYLGSKATFIVGIASALPTFATFPLLSYLARAQGLSTLVWAVALLQIALSVGLSLSYGAVFIYISAAAPNRASLGATNGLCQLSVSLMRAIGPAVANSLFSLSMEKEYMGGWLVYYVLLATTCVALWVAAQLPRRPWA